MDQASVQRPAALVSEASKQQLRDVVMQSGITGSDRRPCARGDFQRGLSCRRLDLCSLPSGRLGGGMV